MSVINDAMPLRNIKVQPENHKTWNFSPMRRLHLTWKPWAPLLHLTPLHWYVIHHENYLGHISLRCHINCTLVIFLTSRHQSISMQGRHAWTAKQSIKQVHAMFWREVKGWGRFGFSLTSFSLISYLDECFPWLFLLSFFRSVWERSRESCFSLCSDW